MGSEPPGVRLSSRFSVATRYVAPTLMLIVGLYPFRFAPHVMSTVAALAGLLAFVAIAFTRSADTPTRGSTSMRCISDDWVTPCGFHSRRFIRSSRYHLAGHRTLSYGTGPAADS